MARRFKLRLPKCNVSKIGLSEKSRTEDRGSFGRLWNVVSIWGEWCWALTRAPVSSQKPGVFLKTPKLAESFKKDSGLSLNHHHRNLPHGSEGQGSAVLAERTHYYSQLDSCLLRLLYLVWVCVRKSFSHIIPLNSQNTLMAKWLKWELEINVWNLLGKYYWSLRAANAILKSMGQKHKRYKRYKLKAAQSQSPRQIWLAAIWGLGWGRGRMNKAAFCCGNPA